MKTRLKTVMIALLVASSALAKKEELSLYTWTDYIPQEVIEKFETKYDCKVNLSFFDSAEEMLAKLQAGGASQYDVVFPSDYILYPMTKMGILMPLDHSKIPNLKNLNPKFADPVYDPSNAYSVAYQWGTTGIIYNKKKFAEPVESWGALLNPDPGIRFSLYGAEREMIGFLLTYNGHSLNETSKKSLKEAVDVALTAKKKEGFKGFVTNVAGANQVKAGIVDISICNSADSTLAMADNEDIGFAIPKEGTVLWCDNLAIPAKAPNPDLAHTFLNFILDAQIGADISNYLWFGSPNKASFPLLNKEMTEDPNLYPDEETMKKLEIINDSSANSAMYGEVWKMIKTR